MVGLVVLDALVGFVGLFELDGLVGGWLGSQGGQGGLASMYGKAG